MSQPMDPERDPAPAPDLIGAARAEADATGVEPVPDAASSPGEHAGDRIGRYKLLEEIGEGGMGTVWMAQQAEPVKRKVALKIIKLGHGHARGRAAVRSRATRRTSGFVCSSLVSLSANAS